MTKNIAETSTQVELHVPDFKVVKKFYGKLGFEVVWEEPPSKQHGYLVIKRDENIIAFFCGNIEVYKHRFFSRFLKDTPRGYAVEIIIYISDNNLEEFYQSFINQGGIKYIVEPIRLQPWGKKDSRIMDPFGYYIRFSEPDNILFK